MWGRVWMTGGLCTTHAGNWHQLAANIYSELLLVCGELRGGMATCWSA